MWRIPNSVQCGTWDPQSRSPAATSTGRGDDQHRSGRRSEGAAPAGGLDRRHPRWFSGAVTPRDTYTHGHHQSVLRSHTWRTAVNSAAYLLDRLSPGQRLLDVGCGPGTITLDLAELVAPGEVVGLDVADAVVAEAERARLERGIDNVSFRTGDVYALAFDPGSFDVVHAHQVLQHLSDPVAALAEMRRVCRPGGWVGARDSDYAAMTWAPADERLDRWMDLYHQIARGNSAEPDAGRHLLGWAQRAGFGTVVPSASVWCFATPEDRSWWGGVWAERVTASAFADQALDRGLSTATELEELAAAWRSWAVRPDGWFAILHGEVLCQP
jgi:ubiquinone/menaquinone biosynthesis C-methylase UbiE